VPSQFAAQVRIAPAQFKQERGSAAAPCSSMPEESEVDSREHQNNANVYYQSFPESVSEERDIHADNDDYHCHHVKSDGDCFTHFSLHGLHSNESNDFLKNRSDIDSREWMALATRIQGRCSQRTNTRFVIDTP
jgi:hypothetical protein